MMVTINVNSSRREELLDITHKVKKHIPAGHNGVCVVFVPHTTAGVTINENADPDVNRDIVVGLGKLIPEKGDYRHMEGNSDAHIKASLVGSSVTIPVENDQLALGTWQGVYFCEFDGPRRRKVFIQFL